MLYNLRFWEEILTPGDIVKKAMPLLTEFSAGVALALYPVSLTRKNANAIRKLTDAGVEVTFWPLLEKDQGYFPGERNSAEYTSLVRHQVAWAEKNEIKPEMLAVDLEMPIQQMMGVTKASGALGKAASLFYSLRDNLDRDRYLASRADFKALNAWLQDRGIRTMTAVMPWVALEMEGDHYLVQDMTETPAEGIGWDLISPMLYSSMIAGMSGGLMSDRDAHWLIYDMCNHLREKYGGRAGVSLGITGESVLDEDWKVEGPDTIVEDLSSSLAAGIRDVTVFSLEGILSRPDPRSWFEALAAARPAVPEKSRKVSDGLAVVRRVYPYLARAIEWYRKPP